MTNANKTVQQTLLKFIAATVFVCSYLPNAQAGDKTFKVVDEKLFYKIIDSIKGAPQEKGEFETTSEFNERKREYANSISKKYKDVVYVFKHDTSPYYDADESKLKVYTPLRKVYSNPFYAIWNHDERYGIQLPRFREKAGVVQFDEMQRFLLGRKSAKKIIQHIVTVFVPKIKEIKDGDSQIEIAIPPTTAKTYKGKYRWVVGLSFNFEEGVEFDKNETVIGDDYLDEIKKGYLEYMKFYETNGRLSFLALIIEGESTALFEYYSPNIKKSTVEKFLK